MSIRCLMLSIAIVALPPPPADAAERAPLTPTQARAAFERFRALAGRWKERSTKGWTEHTVYELIAKGSVLLSRSEFDDPAAAAEGMADAIHLDGDRLLLTHYCEAGNQPRLVASSATPDLKEIEFTFLDGTNLRSRDQGHMDRIVFRFEDASHFRSQWDWYADGHARPFEEVTHERIR